MSVKKLAKHRAVIIPGLILSLALAPWPVAQGTAQTRNQPARDRYLIASEYLRAVAARSGAIYLRAERIESSSFAFALIANELRNQYTLAYYPTNDKRDGGFRTIAVSVKGGDFSVRARQGYRAPNDEKAEEKGQDGKSGN